MINPRDLAPDTTPKLTRYILENEIDHLKKEVYRLKNDIKGLRGMATLREQTIAQLKSELSRYKKLLTVYEDKYEEKLQ